MAKGIRRKLKTVLERVNKEITSNSNGKYGRGLAREGYAGGYAQALLDVDLALDGIKPSTRRYWD